MANVDNEHHFECKTCGSQLNYHVGSDVLKCIGCGKTEKILTPLREIREWSLDEALSLISNNSVTQLTRLSDIGRDSNFESNAVGSIEVDCFKCGAQIEWAPTLQSGRCHYCKTALTLADNRDKRNPIEALIPFNITKVRAERAFAEWIGNRWFAPNALKNMKSHIKSLQGVYIPHWTFDTNTYTRYTGKRGEYYYVTVTRTDSEGNQYQEQERRTRWYSARGSVNLFFDDILVLASFVAPRKIVEKLEPWPLEKAKPYDKSYLIGLGSEYYQLPLGKAFYEAKQQMSGEIHYAIRRDIGGDEQRINSQDTQYSDNTYKLMLMPVWISAFQYKDKDYVTLINGATGEVQGQYPKSTIKIVLATLFVLSLAYIFFYFAWPYIEAELQRNSL